MTTQQKLTDFLDAYSKWLNGKPGGKRADLRGADLRGADIRRAKLVGANLCGADLCRAKLRNGVTIANAEGRS